MTTLPESLARGEAAQARKSWSDQFGPGLAGTSANRELERARRAGTLFIGTTLQDNPVAHHFEALALALVERGHRVVLITPHRKTELERHEDNPAVYTWPSERPTRWRDARFLVRLIRHYHPDCLIANFAAVNMMSVVGWLMGTPARVAWYRTISSQLSDDNDYSWCYRQYLRIRKSLVYRLATQVVTNSRASLEDLNRVYWVPRKKCRVFHNALSDPLSKLQNLNPVPQPGRLVCVGRLFPSKGQDVLLRALPALRKKFPHLSLELIGEGPAKAQYEELARNLGLSDHCSFTGTVEHTEVLRRMASAVATAVPSRSEAFGLVNIESMAVGTPVVASAVGGIVEIVRDGLDGFLVPPDDPEALAERLGQLLAEPELRARLSVNARRRFLSAFEQRQAVAEQTRWQEGLFPGGGARPLGKQETKRKHEQKSGDRG